MLAQALPGMCVRQEQQVASADFQLAGSSGSTYRVGRVKCFKCTTLALNADRSALIRRVKRQVAVPAEIRRSHGVQNQAWLCW